jgi:hypothetical protein
MQASHSADHRPTPKDAKIDPIAAKDAPTPKSEEAVDLAVEGTFPASDPPSYMGGAHTGAPVRKSPRSNAT